ncbi:hypothetical protein [Spongiivirga citrea]|uniref:Uncharacterized protein n=1 Tax=Spongiivirga citrea TaxID=1481457 RepID=A0A6M0CM12_9FLAO|nr:hypothetical protein [Spongiivirga citrea]NER18931.1 hypothetical protein [Spongiivirga citrea]
MKLTKRHIDHLYHFTSKHYVEHFDVQTELVDHLANGIELQWQGNPNLSFENALQVEFKKFGVCGFADVVAEKTKAMNKRYYKLIWIFFKSYFSWPKVIVLILFTALVFSGLNIISAPYRIDAIVICYMILVLTGFVFLIKSMRRRKTMIANNKVVKKPIFLLEDIISKTGNVGFIGISLVQLPNLIFGHGSTLTSSSIILVISIITVLFIVLLYIVHIVLPGRAHEFLSNEYEEYRLLNV